MFTSFPMAAAALVSIGLLAATPGDARADRGQHGGRSGAAGKGQSGGRTAVPRGDDSRGARAAVPTNGKTGATDGQADSGNTGTPHATPREGEATRGKAVPRGSVPPPNGGTTVIIPRVYGLYPWGFGGLGFGYYGGFYDPWYGGDPYPRGGYQIDDQGSLRLKVKPREAEVFVDGYYAGVVDDFDGIFQKLHLRSGPHRIEVRAPDFETLTFDVDIHRDQTITYQGELKPIR